MVMEAVSMVQKRFYEDYPPHPKEVEYNYKCSSTMKPTQVEVRPLPMFCFCFVLFRFFTLTGALARERSDVAAKDLRCCAAASFGQNKYD